MAWGNWSLDPSLAYVVLAGSLYWLGGRRMNRAHDEPWRSWAFAGGLATIVVALDSPVGTYADQLFWVHMLQHILLLTLAPPLVLLGRPWPRMWRGLPRAARASLGRAVVRSRWTAPVRALARPLPAWAMFNGTIVLWHIPAAYDATLSSGVVHACEHAMFFFCGLLFWARVVDPGPLRPRLGWIMRSVYVVGAMVVGWTLAVLLVVVSHPIYSHYADLVDRPGGLTAMEDQQIAGGMMWVPGSISYTIAALFTFWRWLAPDSAGQPGRAAVTT